jgi:hypothetical protein
VAVEALDRGVQDPRGDGMAMGEHEGRHGAKRRLDRVKDPGRGGDVGQVGLDRDGCGATSPQVRRELLTSFGSMPQGIVAS